MLEIGRVVPRQHKHAVLRDLLWLQEIDRKHVFPVPNDLPKKIKVIDKLHDGRPLFELRVNAGHVKYRISFAVIESGGRGFILLTGFGRKDPDWPSEKTRAAIRYKEIVLKHTPYETIDLLGI